MSILQPGQTFPPGLIGVGQEPGRYVNAVQMRSSQWDVAIDFQHHFAASGSQGENPQVLAQNVARVVMSPQHAKALALALQTTVEQWEERFGALPSVDHLLPQETESQ
jgi:hypothetical protein